MEDRWLSVNEIGDYLGIKRDTVYKWISEKDGDVPKLLTKGCDLHYDCLWQLNFTAEAIDERP